ncbi:MAG: shikimate dehydrogenase [Eubacterium sp.]|nr:shikimate dehydrogenase [Eubacterium sp.]
MRDIPVTGKTMLTGLLGSPVAHSLSPLMHNTAYRMLGLDYVYLCFDVEEKKLSEAVRGLQACGIRGFNLTMPHKNRIMDLLDTCTPAARLVGAVNTVVQEDGKLIGHNTDGAGFWKAMEEAGTAAEGQQIVLLGGGGAASAIAVQAALDKAAAVRIFLRQNGRFYARTVRLAETLREKSSCDVQVCPLEDAGLLAACVRKADILINATPVGMVPDTESTLITDRSLLHPALTVADIVYHPQKTRLLSEAEQAGCRICPGLGMLLHQGAEAFRIWTGKKMPVDAIRKILFP